VARVRRIASDPAAADADRPGSDRSGPDADPEAVARQICLQLLTAAPRTRAQLADALARRGVPQDAADAVLDRFADVRLIDDAMFARAWVDSRHHGRGLSRRALAAELRQRGVAAPDIQSAVSHLDPEQEYATARALVERRLASTRGLPAPARIRRLTGFLARKGYPAELCYRVVRAALAEQPPDSQGLGSGAADSAVLDDAFSPEAAFDDIPDYDPAND
jgi:regulatory protein